MSSTLMVLTALALAPACTPPMAAKAASAQQSNMQTPAGAKELFVGGGCFWCIEAQLEMYQGVLEVEAGYAGGKPGAVSYQEVGRGDTGHAETARIVYNPQEVGADDLLRIFFVIHDPTQLNRQGADIGTQYRSVVFYRDAEEKALIEKIREEVVQEKIWPREIVTTIEPLGEYIRAEEYHQDYYGRYTAASQTEKASMNAGYCANVIEPKVRKFREKFKSKLKKD
ncbi:MAG: peptide-methionine (S)-S-oxide reductase MsrA [Fimbriimonadaceae bacterium]